MSRETKKTVAGVWKAQTLASAGTFFKHDETNSFMGREKCSSSCRKGD